MNINRNELIDYLELTQEDMNALDMLGNELWYGPFYLTDEANAEDSLTHNGETIYLCDWSGETILGDAFPKLVELAGKVWDALPSTLYYEEDSGWFGTREPEGEILIDHLGEEERQELINTYELPADADDDTIIRHLDDEDRFMYWCEPAEYYELTRRDILDELVGSITAHEMAYHF